MSRWDEVGEGCFRRRYASFDLNIGVVRSADALLVLDTRADLRQADELLADLRVFGRPVGWVVNSHDHFDHTFGNQRFVEHAARRSDADAVVDVQPDVELWGHVALPPALLGDEEDLRRRLRSRYGDAAGDEYDRVVLTPPDRLVVDRHRLDLGDRAVDLVHFGWGHTDNDLVVVVPDSGVVFAGDLLEESAPPAYGGDCHPLDWPATVGGLLATEAVTFVPGHGDVMSRSAAIEQASALGAVAALIRDLRAAGVPAADAAESASGRWPYPLDAIRTAVRRGYEALA